MYLRKQHTSHLHKLLLGIIVITFLLAQSKNALGVQRTLHIPTIDYPPLMGVDHGIMTDIVREAFATRSIKVDFEIYPMVRIPWAVTDGNSDAAVGSILWFDDKMQRERLLSSTLYISSMHLFYKKSRFEDGLIYSDLSELKPYVIGYIPSGLLMPMFTNKGIKPELVPDIRSNATKLQLSRIDMFAATELGGWGAIREQFPNFVKEFAMSEPLASGTGDIIFPADKKELKHEFDQGFRTIVENGTYQAILKQYYVDQPIPPELKGLGR